MELNVKLTADELMNVVDAAMGEAIDRGYCEDNETVDDMLHIVDAALSAMGIEIVPADEDDEDEEEDNDPIADMLYVLDDGRTAISEEDAYLLLDMIKETGMDRGLSEDEAAEAARVIFMQIGKDYGIDVVEEDEDEEEEEEPEYPDNPVSRCVFIHNGKRAIKESDANEIVSAMTEVIEDKLGFLPDEVKQSIRGQMLLQVFNDNGIKIVVKGA